MATWSYTIGPGYYYDHYELLNNAQNVKDYLEAQGFSPPAIVGILANMEHESYVNPGQQQHGYHGDPSSGYGLVQWTPGTKIINYANSVNGDWYDGDIQMDFLMINGPQSWGSAYNVSWNEYKELTDVYYAVEVFFWNFERGTWDNVMYSYADFYYNYFYGTMPPQPPTPPQPPDPPGGDTDYLMALFLYLAKGFK